MIRKVKAQRVRAFTVGSGLPDLKTMEAELDDMVAVLKGEVPAPVTGTLALMECSDAFYARGKEMEMLLLRGEREGTILRGSNHYRFRTGELRSFLDLCKSASELGSRRLTQESLLWEQEQRGR
jgi:hypothetical protein